MREKWMKSLLAGFSMYLLMFFVIAGSAFAKSSAPAASGPVMESNNDIMKESKKENANRWTFKVPVELTDTQDTIGNSAFTVTVYVYDKFNKQRGKGHRAIPIDANGNFSGVVEVPVYPDTWITPDTGYRYKAFLDIRDPHGSNNLVYMKMPKDMAYASTAVPGTELVTEVEGTF